MKNQNIHHFIHCLDRIPDYIGLLLHLHYLFVNLPNNKLRKVDLYKYITRTTKNNIPSSSVRNNLLGSITAGSNFDLCVLF